MWRRVSILTFSLLLPLTSHAFEARLVDASGRAVAGAQISVADQAGSARSDSSGAFSIEPDPKFPAVLIVIGSRGEVFPPIYLGRAAAEVRIEPAFRESVTVSIGATPNIEGTPAAAPVVVGAEELEQRKPAHVAEAIAATPGVALRGEGAPAVPVVRGLAGGRTLLLVDDARIVSERRAGPSATFVDPLTLGSIEVSRGPGSVAYGSDAIGGVVHLRPRDPVPGAPELRYDLWSTFGAVNGRSAAAEASADIFGGAVLASIHARAADDATDARGDEIANSQYRDRGASLRFVRQGAGGRLRAAFMTSVARDVGAPTSEAVLTTYPDERASLLTIAFDRERAGFWNSAALRASLGAYSVTTDRVRPSATESAAVKARDASLRFSGERIEGRSRFVTGFDFVSRFNLRASDSIDDADRGDLGVFASWETPVTSLLQLSTGARGDYIRSENRGGFYGDRSRSDVAFSGFGALTAGPIEGFTATIQVASGFREPTLSDRYFRGVSGRGFINGNPDLDPERSVQLDAGVRWSGSRARVALFAYDYQIRKLVERYRDGTDFYFRNRGEGKIRGLELEASFRLPRNLELQTGAAIARGEDADTGDALDDIAPPTLHASLRWAAESASAFVTASTCGRDDEPGPVEVERPGYTTIDLGAGWRLSRFFEVRAVIRNLTNAQHFGSADAASAEAPGRSVMIGINR